MIKTKRTKWADKAYELSLKGYEAAVIKEMLSKDFPDLTLGAVRTSIKRDRKRNGTQRDSQGRPATQESHKVSEINGNKVFDDITEYQIGQDITPYSIMKEKGLDANDWDVISFTKNTWQQQTKDGEKINLCQSKLTVRPKKKDTITFEEIDDWFKSKDFNVPKINVNRLKYDKSKEILEIDVADLHCGLLAWRYETNNDWDLHICQDKFLQGIRDIVDRAQGRKFKTIYFITLGDVIHVDNMQGTTTKGTVQQTDGRVTKIFDFAYDTIVKALDMLRELNSPIKYIYLCGNHDTVIGYCLAKMLQVTMNDIYFDVDPKPQKAIHFGKCLIGLTHGDMPRNNKGDWIINDFRKELGLSDFVEEHSGHFHTESVKTSNSGVTCRALMAQAGNSYWENSQGYRSLRGIQCFVWNEDKGLRESWYYYY